MDYEITWRDALVSSSLRELTLQVDPQAYSLDGHTRRYIDMRDERGDYLVWCVRVKFIKETPLHKQNEVMQTVLMMARARYGR